MEDGEPEEGAQLPLGRSRVPPHARLVCTFPGRARTWAPGLCVSREGLRSPPSSAAPARAGQHQHRVCAHPGPLESYLMRRRGWVPIRGPRTLWQE